MQHVIRPVREDEWEKVRDLRIASLQDPVAPIAFLDTVELAEARPDSVWQERTANAASGRAVRQFVAVGPDGVWNGSVTVLVEELGTTDFLDREIETTQGHVVGVFVREGQRGTGVAEELFRAGLEWAWSLEGPALERVRLYVHERNERAQAFYRRIGFQDSGVRVPLESDPSAKEMEFVIPRP
ncbi:GNAT family N-acetyltransferase [Streptomyces sp. NRRL F-2580]|uniref:GNAT family N-acetyltransferase n=1 Tax=Streptomyces sp. NRRL F-2580 TaxID=1463841 RepID=UPI0004CBDDF4|nr:GNAT family N-acetyltransferase [Streptomyces sp. NRRL F-2580]